MLARSIALVFNLLLLISLVQAQHSGGVISGSFQTDFQYYQKDSAVGITDSTLQGKRIGSNTFLNLTYSSHNLEAGMRLESFLPAMNGYDQRYTGSGIPYKYVRFFDDTWDVTAGNFYEQFGNGLIFRSYQDWDLGVDNSVEGLRVKYRHPSGMRLTAISGVQRLYWNRWSRDADRGVLAGADAEVDLNELIPFLGDKTLILLGSSFITKTQKDNDPIYNIPKNVAAFSWRLNASRGPFAILGEYARKINDPSADNGMIYKPGEVVFAQISYAVRGFSLSAAVKRLDNMSFRSDRNAGLNDLTINYLPALTKQHLYSMPEGYPYATQTNGEMGFSVNAGYKIKKGSWLGGNYGTDLAFNFSRITDITRLPLDSLTPIGQAGTMGYTTDFFKSGDKFYENVSLDIQRRVSKNVKLNLLYAWIYYNIGVIEGHAGEEDVRSHSAVVDLTWKLTSRQALRFEMQHLYSKQHEGNWAVALVEYTNRGFFASIADEWNYGNFNDDEKFHYAIVSMGYTKGATKVMASYGRQKDGILCVGGVCRFVPAITGLTLTLTSTF